MCDCENMTTSVRDEKIALVFETVFEEQASDEGEVTAVLWPKNFSGKHGNMMFFLGQMGSTSGGAGHLGKTSWEGKDRETKVSSFKTASPPFYLSVQRRKFDPEDKGVIDWKDRSHLNPHLNVRTFQNWFFKLPETFSWPFAPSESVTPTPSPRTSSLQRSRFSIR